MCYHQQIQHFKCHTLQTNFPVRQTILGIGIFKVDKAFWFSALVFRVLTVCVNVKKLQTCTCFWSYQSDSHQSETTTLIYGQRERERERER